MNIVPPSRFDFLISMFSEDFQILKLNFQLFTICNLPLFGTNLLNLLKLISGERKISQYVRRCLHMVSTRNIIII